MHYKQNIAWPAAHVLRRRADMYGAGARARVSTGTPPPWNIRKSEMRSLSCAGLLITLLKRTPVSMTGTPCSKQCENHKSGRELKQ